jgi:mannosyl-oligosaccharide alpha-1,2-mannosidase
MVLSRWKALVFFGVIFLLFLFSNKSPIGAYHRTPGQPSIAHSFPDYKKVQSEWSNIPQRFSVTSMKTVPTSIPQSIPRIQHDLRKETATEKQIRISRLNAVKGNFTHAWNGYKDHAWLRDEVMPLSGGSQDPFGGWAATLVDSLGSFNSVLFSALLL